MKARQEKMEALMRDLLGDRYLSLAVRWHRLEEDLEADTVKSHATLVDQLTGDERVIDGEGVGLVDAFFNALVESLSPDYPSLECIRFHAFLATGENLTSRSGSGSDSASTVRLEVANRVGRTFVFSDSSRSITASCIKVTLCAVGYFVNSERSFFEVRGLLDDAKARQRPELVTHYTNILSQLVRNASYTTSPEEKEARP